MNNFLHYEHYYTKKFKNKYNFTNNAVTKKNKMNIILQTVLDYIIGE